MRRLSAISIVLAIASLLLAFNLHQRNVVLEEEVAIHREAREQFLREISESASRQAEAEGQIERLRDSFASSNQQISQLEMQLEEARSLIEPEVDELRASIRPDVEAKLLQDLDEEESEREQVAMISELSRLAPERLSSLMRVNALYGDFFNSLNVSDERMKTLVNAFIEMTEMQNDALDEVRESNPPQTKEESEAQILLILDSSLVNEVISRQLTDDELELFTQYQQSHFVEGLPVRPAF